MRCKCVGSKREIFRIYNDLKKNPNYELIRVKNKLNDITRDILINFKSKDTFLVCEMQLALGGRKQQANDHFGHHIY
jgi:hypothetical protein